MFRFKQSTRVIVDADRCPSMTFPGNSNGAGAAGPAPKGGQACRDVGCHRRPIYAFKGDTKALCCPIHR